ncbi:MAG TPA: hypothetical protein PLU64_16715, partial [Saprospiraceae bacterium]|nr:hypothetical protein [Saprospiraceae bacterium]
MDSEVSGQRFVLSAEDWTYQELLETIARELGARPPSIRSNALIRTLSWRAAWLWARLSGKPALLTRETAMNSSLTFYYNNQKSIGQFQFQYTPIRQVVAETARQFLEASQEGLPPKVLPFNN